MNSPNNQQSTTANTLFIAMGISLLLAIVLLASQSMV